MIRGKAWKFGDNVNTDEIIPARYLNTTDETELGSHCMEGIAEGFAAKVSRGDVIVAGDNFGCGSSREHAPVSIKACGIRCVIAKSFARIFFRNAINIGLPIVECGEAVEQMREGDEVEVDVEEGSVRNVAQDRTYQIAAFPPFMKQIIESGGLVEWLK